MSNQLRNPETNHTNHEQAVNHERLITKEVFIESKRPKAEKIEHIRSTVEHSAVESARLHEELKQHEVEPAHHHYITKRIKNDQYKRTILQIQSHLSKGEKRFSKLIHRPIVESVSEFSAKTIARPKPIINGSLFAIIGSVVVFAIAKHVGFEVSNSLFIILFILGYILFVGFELLVALTKKLSPKQQYKNLYD